MNDNEKTLKSAIDEILSSHQLKDKVVLARLKEHWQSLFGKHIDQHTTRIKIYKQVLTIEVDSAPLRQELLFSKELILSRINEFFEKTVVNDLKLK